MPTRTITVTVDLRPAFAVAAARTALEAAKAEWSGAHLTDAESEDARQKVRDAPAAWGCLPANAPAPDNAYCFVERGMGGGTLIVQGERARGGDL